jgi:hypothetical protein
MSTLKRIQKYDTSNEDKPNQSGTVSLKDKIMDVMFVVSLFSLLGGVIYQFYLIFYVYGKEL